MSHKYVFLNGKTKNWAPASQKTAWSPALRTSVHICKASRRNASRDDSAIGYKVTTPLKDTLMSQNTSNVWILFRIGLHPKKNWWKRYWSSKYDEATSSSVAEMHQIWSPKVYTFSTPHEDTISSRNASVAYTNLNPDDRNHFLSSCGNVSTTDSVFRDSNLNESANGIL